MKRALTIAVGLGIGAVVKSASKDIQCLPNNGSNCSGCGTLPGGATWVPNNTDCKVSDCTLITANWTDNACHACDPGSPTRNTAKIDKTGCSKYDCSTTTTWNDDKCKECYAVGSKVYQNTAGSGCSTISCLTTNTWDDDKCSKCNLPGGDVFKKNDNSGCQAFSCSANSNWDNNKCSICNGANSYGKSDGSGCSSINCGTTTAWDDTKCAACNQAGGKVFTKKDNSGCQAYSCSATDGWDDAKCASCDSTNIVAAENKKSCTVSSSASILFAFIFFILSIMSVLLF